MDIKQTIIKIIKSEHISQEEFLNIISEYIYEKKLKYPTDKELKIVSSLISSGQMGIEPMIQYYIEKFNLNVIKVENILTREVLRIDVNEWKMGESRLRFSLIFFL